MPFGLPVPMGMVRHSYNTNKYSIPTHNSGVSSDPTGMTYRGNCCKKVYTYSSVLKGWAMKTQVKQKNPQVGNGISRTVLEAVTIPMALINKRYEYEWVNDCYCRWHGKKPVDFIGKKVADVLGTGVFEVFMKESLDRCFGGEETRKDAWIDFAARGRRYCETVYSPYRPQQNSDSLAIVITYDLSERKRAEEEVRNSEIRFRRLWAASLEAIVFLEDGVIIDANEALSRLFGYGDEDPRGRLATDFIAPERRAHTAERIKARAEGSYETLGIKKDGSVFPIEINARGLEIEGKRITVATVRDLSERKEKSLLKEQQELLEKRLKAQTNALKESEEKFKDIFEHALVSTCINT